MLQFMTIIDEIIFNKFHIFQIYNTVAAVNLDSSFNAEQSRFAPGEFIVIKFGCINGTLKTYSQMIISLTYMNNIYIYIFI